MKRTRPVRVAVVTFTLGSIALAISCGSPPPNATEVAPVNQLGADAGTSAATDAPMTSDATGTAQPDASVVGDGTDHCAKATVISLATPRSILLADTTAATHDVDAPCTPDGAPDVFYQFTLSRRVLVYADTFGATWNTVLFLLSSTCEPITKTTMDGDAVCSDDECSTSQSRIVALLEPGNYRLGVGGRGGAVGAATVHFELVYAASGIETQLPPGKSEQIGTTGGGPGNVQEEGCLAAGPENGYWWTTCPSDAGGTLLASTCGGATWETLLSTEIPRAQTYVCSSGTCDLQTALTTNVPAGAGMHQLLVDGQAATSAGAYVMEVTRP